MPQVDTVARLSYVLTKVQDKVYEETGATIDRVFDDFLEEGDTSGPDYRSATIAGFGQHPAPPTRQPAGQPSVSASRGAAVTVRCDRGR